MTVMNTKQFASGDELPTQPASEIQEALLGSQWRDAVNAGFKCPECNHFQKVKSRDVIELMASV